MRKIDLNFGIKDPNKQPMRYVMWVFLLFTLMGLPYSVSLSYCALDKFFPIIDIVPGILAVIITTSYIFTLIGMIALYYNFQPKYKSFFLSLSLIFMTIALGTCIAFAFLYSGKKYVDNCIFKFHTFLMDNPNTIEAQWIAAKLNFKQYSNDQKLAIITNYINARSNHACIVIFSIFFVWAITGYCIIYQTYIFPSSTTLVGENTPSGTDKLHFDIV
ncbi:hypothetical protein TVAG_027840 [Trichomonas vaginalis G3]|uniref:Uncharacterized protein n=1 Tax=Trichomonas vaginalis (strain ATCC PRA-98 / G3) TaxID=412133 RepID=A2E523_TRIV3|nr:hypothetical protein TVAGG3_0420560 [Trichomonas vaginalis G3]EAY12231.1 hypothetical protein TVAG_027840 [Trichomonas vaginalis G3]KAI5536017.1 hypothetical protein TVAGG3_0420560 [Trichomonas vaginalis G3]|eukprot:XP_001324454.1 hypothetical protein [Trichomonas vaginalis G3]